jgi:SAM-dependent methyltransferase
MVPLRCPRCRSPFRTGTPQSDDVDRIECAGCGAIYPVRWGIPDLRGSATDPYLSSDEDLRAAERLWTESQRSGFADTLESYYRTNSRVTEAQARQFAHGAIAAEWRSQGVLNECLRATPGTGVGGTFVDAGCGTGSLSLAATRAGFEVLGVDIGLRWLVLAGVRAREAGVRIQFACADSANLPITDASIDVVASEGLLENVPSAGSVMDEAARVLRPGGKFWAVTANRWSVGPDPHIGLPLGGWLGENLVRQYARWRGMVPPRRHLLSRRTVQFLLRTAGLRERVVMPTPIADAQREGASAMVQMGVDGYRWLSRNAGGRQFLCAIGPTLLVVAERAG